MSLVHESVIKVSVTVFCVVVLGRVDAVVGDKVTGSIVLSFVSPIRGATAQCVIITKSWSLNIFLVIPLLFLGFLLGEVLEVEQMITHSRGNSDAHYDNSHFQTRYSTKDYFVKPHFYIPKLEK